MHDPTNGPFSLAASAWTTMIERSVTFKNKRFQPEADEGLRFYCGPYDFFFKGIRNDKFFKAPFDQEQEIIVTVNKVAELVQIFGPFLYHQNPTRRLTTRKIPEIDPNLFVTSPQMFQQVQQVYQASMQEQMTDKAMGALFEAILNVTPWKNDLKRESRMAIDEALITGLGILMHEYRTSPATGKKVCGSWYKSVRDFTMDPDATIFPDQIGWCAFRTVMPRWEAERKWRIPQGVLKASMYSQNGMAATEKLSNSDQPSADLIEVWEVYSKMGCGGRLPQCQELDQANRAAYDLMGDYCYMVIVPGHPWPLNLPPWMFNAENTNAWVQAALAVQWPTPFWIDGGWPFTPIYYHTIPNDPWPMSHLTPGMGELKFMNWAYSKIAGKIAVTSRDLLFIADELADEAKQHIKYGQDLSVIPIKGMEGKTIKDMIQQFQHNTWNSDIWTVLQAITKSFEERVGLSELMYGESARQMRSAQEASSKYDAVSSRPGDMADQVENAMSAAAEREKLCCRWHYQPEDVQALCGIAAAFAWQALVLSQPPERVLDLQARIEADSTKKANKSELINNLTSLAQTMLPMLFQAAEAGMMDPFNNFFGALLDAMNIPDKGKFMLQMPPQQPAPPPDPENDKQREHELELAKQQKKTSTK